MKCPRFAKRHRPLVLTIALATGVGFCLPAAADTELENAQLAALVRQLDLLDHIAEQRSASAATGSRYHFDYARLRADLARIRTGIEDYLSPRRAQPRDPDTLNGEYRREKTASP